MRGITVAVLYARLMADTTQFTTAMAAADGSMEKTALGAQAVGASLFKHVTLPLALIGGVSTKFAIDFQSSMELIHTQAHRSQAVVDSLASSVLNLAGPTATAPEELSKGLYHLASQGVRTSSIMDVLKVSAEGARIGQANLEDVTNALGAVIASNISGVKDYGSAMGMMNSIVGAGDMRMQDLADAFGTALPVVSHLAGVTLNDMGGALAVLGDNLIRGAKAGTALGSALRLMESPSHAGQIALEGIGLKADELQTVIRDHGLVAGIGDLRKHFLGLGLAGNDLKNKMQDVLTSAFGGRQANAIKVLVDEFERLKRKVKEVKDGGSSFASDWQSYMNTTSYSLASAGANMRAMGINIGDILLPVVSQLAGYIGEAANAFHRLSPGMQKTIVIIAGVAAAMGPLAFVFGTFGTMLVFLAANPIVLLIAALAAVVGAIAAAALAPDKLKSVLEHLGMSAHTAGATIKILREVFFALRAAVVWVVNEIKAHWPTISKIFMEVANTTISVVMAVVGFLRQAFGVIEQVVMFVVNAIRNNWGALSGIFMDLVTIIEVVAGIIGTVLGVIARVIMVFVHVAVAIWHEFGDLIISAVKTAFNFIADTIRNVLNVIHGIIDIVTGLITGDWTKVWNGIKEVVSGVWNEIWAIIKTVGKFVIIAAEAVGRGIYDHVVKPVVQIAKDVWHAMTDTWNAVKTVFTNIWNWMEKEAIRAALMIVEPFSHIPRWLGGGWAQDLKTSLQGKLDSINTHAAMEQMKKMAAAGQITGTQLAKSFDKHGDMTTYGKALMAGLAQGIRDGTPAAAKAAADAAGTVTAATKDKFGVKSPSTVFKGIGHDTIQGFIVGFLEGSGSLPATVSAAMNKVLSAAQAATSAKFQEWQTQFQRFKGYVDSAFDAISQAHLTPAGQALAKLQATHDSAATARQVADANASVLAAQQALTAAQGGAYASDADRTAAITKAQNDLTSALQQQAEVQYQIKVAALTQQAAAEDKQYQAQRNLQKQHMDDLLAHYEEMMAKQPGRADYWQQQITKTLDKYGVTYKSSGQAMGQAFAVGLKESEGEIKKVITDLAHMIANILKLHSPAKEGPLSDLDKWWKPFGKVLVSGIDPEDVRRGALGIAGQAQVSLGPGGASDFIGSSAAGASSGPTQIIVPITGNTFLTDRRETLRAIADAIATVAPNTDSRLQMGT